MNKFGCSGVTVCRYRVVSFTRVKSHLFIRFGKSTRSRFFLVLLVSEGFERMAMAMSCNSYIRMSDRLTKLNRKTKNNIKNLTNSLLDQG